MAQKVATMTPPRDLLLGIRKLRRCSELMVTPRRRSAAFPETPKSTRSELFSPSREQAGTSMKRSSLLSQSSRGSPMLQSRSASPRLCPNKQSSLLRLSPQVQKSPSPKTFQGDRFIPNRSRMDFSRSNHVLIRNSPTKATTPRQDLQIPRIKILNFGNLSPRESKEESLSRLGADQIVRPKESRTPDRVLDAPGVLDDQGPYLLDWSEGNMLVLALTDSVYLWDPVTRKTVLLCKSLPFTWITAVKWNADGNALAVASSDGLINCWLQDSGSVMVLKKVIRVISLAWNSSDLTCGDILGHIRHINTLNTEDETRLCFRGHAFAVNTLAWNRQGALLASGCEGGECKVWSGKAPTPTHVLEKCKTSIKALQWCPWLNSVLAVCTAGGTLLVWRISNSITMLSQTDCDSSVTDLKWVKVKNGIFSSHSNGDINLWAFPVMTNILRFKGEENFIISISLSPDSCSLMSLGSDETIRLWTSFQEEKQECSRSVLSKLLVR